jgi:hypothetical protein
MTEKQRILFSEILIMNLEFSNEEDLFKRWRLSKDIRTKLKKLKRSMGAEDFKTFIERGKKAYCSPKRIIKPKTLETIYG